MIDDFLIIYIYVLYMYHPYIVIICDPDVCFFLPADRSALRLQQGAGGASGASQRVYGSRVQSGLPPGAMMEKW
jgi:hypothetical protein